MCIYNKLFEYKCTPQSKECDAQDILTKMDIQFYITYEELKDFFPCLTNKQIKEILSKNKKYDLKKRNAPIYEVAHFQLFKIMEEITKELPDKLQSAITCILFSYLEAISFKKSNTTFINHGLRSNISDILKKSKISPGELSNKTGISVDIIKEAMTNEGIKNIRLGQLLIIGNFFHIPLTYLFDINRLYQVWDLYGSMD